MIKGRLINDCIDFSKRTYEKDKKENHKSIFGGKRNFILNCKEKITKEQFSQKRLVSLYFQGETSPNGNRFFNLNILNNKIEFKYNKNLHFNLNLKISKNQLKQLIELQDLCKQKKSKFTVILNENFINIIFDEIKHEVPNLIENRFIGIDMNPTNIGISVCEYKNNEIKLIDSFDFEFSKSLIK